MTGRSFPGRCPRKPGTDGYQRGRFSGRGVSGLSRCGPCDVGPNIIYLYRYMHGVSGESVGGDVYKDSENWILTLCKPKEYFHKTALTITTALEGKACQAFSLFIKSIFVMFVVSWSHIVQKRVRLHSIYNVFFQLVITLSHFDTRIKRCRPNISQQLHCKKNQRNRQ